MKAKTSYGLSGLSHGGMVPTAQTHVSEARHGAPALVVVQTWATRPFVRLRSGQALKACSFEGFSFAPVWATCAIDAGS